MERLTAVVFDMNGVLVDDELAHEEAFRQVLATRGIALSSEDWRRNFMGRTDGEGLALFVAAEVHSLDDVPGLVDAKLAAYRELIRGNIRPVEGALALVRGAARRVPGNVGMVTSSTRWEASTITRALGILDCIATMVTAEDVSRGKPDPEPYLAAARLLGVSPEHCLVFEDTPAGLASARQAGMTCVAVTSTHPADALALADMVVERLDVGLLDAFPIDSSWQDANSGPR